MIGKQAYIAPEQLRGKAAKQSDIYALGATIFFLLTGEDPEPLSVSRPSSGIEQLDSLVAQCTEMEKEDRPQSAAEILERLEQIRLKGVGQTISAK